MLKKGITYVHEHTTIDLSGLKENDDCHLNTFTETIDEFKYLYTLGVRNIIDVTNIGMKRNPLYVNAVAKASNMNIIQGTGWYQERFFDSEIKDNDIDYLANKMIKEINEGIDDTGIKASFIGEIGTSIDGMSIDEKKLFKASVKAALECGVIISTHCTLGLHALQQLDLFMNENFPLNRVVFGHTDLTGDIEYILHLLKSGAYVEFDTVGKNNYMSDTRRIEMLKIISDLGYEDQIMLSMDITRKSQLKVFGGTGYHYLLEVFIPNCLDSGIKQAFIDKMLIHNPMNFYTRKDVI